MKKQLCYLNNLSEAISLNSLPFKHYLNSEADKNSPSLFTLKHWLSLEIMLPLLSPFLVFQSLPHQIIALLN